MLKFCSCPTLLTIEIVEFQSRETLGGDEVQRKQ